jgi:two-component system, NtrC family, sensor kinase
MVAEGDPSLLRIVLENLLNNAYKFSNKGDHPKVEFGGRGDGVFFVRDNGVGFDMAHAKKLFSTFQRMHAQTDFPGSGLGLAIVHRILTRHGGEIWAESEPGKGACFYFRV